MTCLECDLDWDETDDTPDPIHDFDDCGDSDEDGLACCYCGHTAESHA